jgi:putative ABC transport system permease protein
MRAARVGWVVTTENALIAALGLAAGFPLALAVLRFFVRLFASDLFTLPVHVYPRTVAAAFIGVGLTLLIAQRPSLRHVARMDLAESAKLRE